MAAIPHIIPVIQENIKSGIEQWPCVSNRGSSIGHGCARYLAYMRFAWKLRDLHGPTLQIIFDDGHFHEKASIGYLVDAGFEITEVQRAYEWREYGITGHIDGKIKIPPIKKPIPFDIKSMNPFTYTAIAKLPFEQRFQYFKESKKPFERKVVGQVLAYMLMDNSRYGLIFCKNKQPFGDFPLMQISIDLHADDNLQWTEEMLQRVEKVNKALDQWGRKTGIPTDDIMPERIEYSEVWCNGCEFNKLCLPGKYNLPPKVAMDEELGKLLEQSEKIRDYPNQLKKMNDRIKVLTQNLLVKEITVVKSDIGKEQVLICNGFEVKCQVGTSKKYDIPVGVKSKYLKETPYWKQPTIKNMGV